MKDIEGVTKKRCYGDECPNEAGTLQCPTCQKQGSDSFFCSQDCFKKNWVSVMDSYGIACSNSFPGNTQADPQETK